MSSQSLNLIGIYELFEHKTNGPISLTVIQKLQSWNLIASDGQIRCNNGHFLKLCNDARFADGFSWRCRESYKDPKKKKSKCDVYHSIRKDTFFHKSQLSMYNIVTFSYLWLENVSLDFIKKQTKIAQHTAVDWSAFHREVVFDAMIMNHEKIGKLLHYE